MTNKYCAERKNYTTYYNYNCNNMHQTAYVNPRQSFYNAFTFSDGFTKPPNDKCLTSTRICFIVFIIMFIS